MKESDEEAAEKWLVDNDWDYKKYRDKRPDRSAYDGLMNYEISDVLLEAFSGGCAHKEAQLMARIERLREYLMAIKKHGQHPNYDNNWAAYTLDLAHSALSADEKEGK